MHRGEGDPLRTVTGQYTVIKADYSVTTFNTRCCAARLRWFSSRIFLRNRRFLGVASTYSSELMYSRARSRESFKGGLSWMPLPSPCERMLVSFFALQGLTGMSLSRAFSPTIMPL